jgi:hypothetical protein
MSRSVSGYFWLLFLTMLELASIYVFIIHIIQEKSVNKRCFAVDYSCL